jgi:mevalonate kinase
MSQFLSQFQCRVHGKWILAGEHAVLRGSRAIAFPVYGKELSLRWEGRSQPFHAEFIGDRGPEFQLLFSGVFDRALDILGRTGDTSLKRGEFTVESTLPVGAGLGASAALSVAVGRWFLSQGLILESDLFKFCREIENLFHGESSGVDVAVAIENRGLLFSRSSGFEAFDPKWSPNWYISYSGARGITSECVTKVKELIAKDPVRGEEIDRHMRDAVSMAYESLISSSASSLETLKQSILLARTCFENWGLTGGELGQHMAWLEASGAIAVKPTGSGGGGFALSLWPERPSPEIESKLIPVYRTLA